MFSPAMPMTSVSGVWTATGSSPLPEKSPATDGRGAWSRGGVGDWETSHSLTVSSSGTSEDSASKSHPWSVGGVGGVAQMVPQDIAGLRAAPESLVLELRSHRRFHSDA